MAKVDGATVIARCLRQQGIEHMFGVLGVPVFGIARRAEKEGVRFYAFRNEQAASYAAGAAGYLTGRPGICLAVSGPGMIHAVAGLANAWSNCWPMILIGGANDSYQNGQGAFQEAPQMDVARPFVKYAARPDSIKRIPFFFGQAVRQTLYGRPGAAYLELPADLINGEVDEDEVDFGAPVGEAPRPPANEHSIEEALNVLASAKNPLVIVGKGAAYARAEQEVRQFLETTQLPFLPTPMGKGVVPDSSPLSVAGARSFALKNADAILLLGTRLNWILHFGAPPRFNPDVRIIQAEIEPEEIGNNLPAEVGLVGDIKTIVGQLNTHLQQHPWQYDTETLWRTELMEKVQQNQQTVKLLLSDDKVPMGYYRALREIRDNIPSNAIIVSEGSNTMDIGRTVLPNFEARHRLDAGTFGTMGVGLGFAIAAAVTEPNKKVIAVEGDSAFGFSGMEVEVACRFGLPIIFIIFNNNMGGGQRYVEDARYEKIIEAFGGTGYYVRTPDELRVSLRGALANEMPSIINVVIDPESNRKPQEFAWLTR